MSVVPIEVEEPNYFITEENAFPISPLLKEEITHYCAGCHHGIAHRLITEVLSEMDLAGETIGIASIGCSSFIYDYIDIDWVEAPHGRASAVATGVKRALPDKIVFTYQGDGDLGAIGLCESIHAANRGEHISVLFINNTVYGMTGGQMGPTTLVGQKTTTSPKGRNASKEGAPLRIAEIMAGLDSVAFSARCSLHSMKHVLAAKKAIRKAFDIQYKGIGYSFVEMLAGCPTNWRIDPRAANKYIADAMVPVFPLGTFKDIVEDNKRG